MTTNTQTTGDGAGYGTASATSRQPEPREAQNPFSELRGLIERASPGPWFQGMKGGGNVQSQRGPVADTLRFGNTSSEAVADYDNARLIVAAVNSLGPLLDERDRLEQIIQARDQQLTEEIALTQRFVARLEEATARALSAEAEAQRLREALRLQEQMLGNVLFNYEQQPEPSERVIASIKTMQHSARSALSDQGEG